MILSTILAFRDIVGDCISSRMTWLSAHASLTTSVAPMPIDDSKEEHECYRINQSITGRKELFVPPRPITRCMMILRFDYISSMVCSNRGPRILDTKCSEEAASRQNDLGVRK
jgi:hypothetical protein